MRVAYLRPDGREATGYVEASRERSLAGWPALTGKHRASVKESKSGFVSARGSFAKRRKPQPASDIAATSRPVSAVGTESPEDLPRIKTPAALFPTTAPRPAQGFVMLVPRFQDS